MNSIVLFSDLTNEFAILDFTLSHSVLLIRSLKNRERDYNIDIFFKPVKTLIMPVRMKGLEISVLEDKDKEKSLIDDYDFSTEYNSKIFSIKNSEGKTYFINAMIFTVYHNKLDILETSITRYDWGTFGEQIL